MWSVDRPAKALQSRGGDDECLGDFHTVGLKWPIYLFGSRSDKRADHKLSSNCCHRLSKQPNKP